ELGEIEVRAGVATRQLACVVEEVEAEVEEGAGHEFAVDDNVAFFEMPAARPDEEDGGVVDERIVLVRGRVVVGDGAADGVDEVELAVQEILPGGRCGVFEVGHEDARAGVERVDDHLAVDRAGDLDAAILKICGDGRDGPRSLADLAGRGEEVGAFASVDTGLACYACAEELLAARVELAMKRDDEGEGFGGEDAVVAV